MTKGWRSFMTVLMVGAALAAVAVPQHRAQAESNDVRATAPGAPPSVVASELTAVPFVSIELNTSHVARINGDTNMATVLNRDSLVRFDSSTSIDSAGRAPDVRQRFVHRDSSVMSVVSTVAALPASSYRPSLEPTLRHRATLPNLLTAPSAYTRGRTIGHDAFPLYL